MLVSHSYSHCEQRKELTSAELYVLLVSPDHQRQGIGSLLLAEGLKEVDELGLQCVLGASPEGEELYKRFGFEEYEVMHLRLWEYEGGEGMDESCEAW
jgi:predicted N-acetyltransferase YhbS